MNFWFWLSVLFRITDGGNNSVVSKLKYSSFEYNPKRLLLILFLDLRPEIILCYILYCMYNHLVISNLLFLHFIFHEIKFKTLCRKEYMKSFNEIVMLKQIPLKNIFLYANFWDRISILLFCLNYKKMQ
jgi:hypothetical protein